MKQYKFLILTTIVVLIISLLILAIILIVKNNLESNTLNSGAEIPNSYSTNSYPVSFAVTIESENKKISAVKKAPKSVSDLYVSGWIPDWNLSDGYNTMVSYGNYFNSISPFWYTVNPDGTLNEVKNATNPKIMQFARDKGIKIIPSITMFDASLITQVLDSEEDTQRHIDSIINKIEEYNYDGIDLDYEEMMLQDKDLFIGFIEKLSLELKSRGKIFSMSILPKWHNFKYSYLPQTRQVQDYTLLSEFVDEFRIMTYEFSGRTSDIIGPIAPLEWQELVLQYAIYSGVPREKIVLGVHTYAYDWKERPIIKELDLLKQRSTTGSTSEKPSAYYGESMQKLFSNYSVTSEYNSEWGEAIGRYDFKGESRVVFYMNNQSIEARKKLAADYGIKGIAYWKIGDEGDIKL